MGTPLRVLIVEDSPDDAFLLQRHLTAGGYDLTSERVESAPQMAEALSGKEWDLVISDYVLPQFSGLAALELLRANGNDAPFIIVSGNIGEETAVEAMKAGANDYLLKGNLARLVPAIERELRDAGSRREKRAAEEALKESERRYRRLVMALTDYIYTVHLRDGKVIATSHGPGCEPVTGYTPGEYDADPDLWHRMIVEEDRREVKERVRLLIAGNDVRPVEHRIIHKDGSARWVRNTMVARYDEGGKLVAYDGLIADITERKMAEEALRLQSAALKAAANAIVITGRDGKVTWANPAFTSLTGFRLDEIVNRDLKILRSGRHEAAFYRKLWETVLDGQVWHGEIVNRRRNGSEYVEEQTITPVRDDRERVTHFIAIKQDVTDRKRSERALLENARMVRELELAREIQQSLLPSTPPAVPGVKIACRCIPASHVGGDFYDFFPHPDGTIGIVIADVSGHSIGEALIMAEIRSILRARLSELGSPAEVLVALNGLLHEDLSRAELFVSVFYARLAPESGMLTFANAGHTPPLLYVAQERAFRELDAEGLVMGVKQEVAFEERQESLGRGSLLFLYTDGITETSDPADELFGTERLESVLAGSLGEEPERIIAAIHEAVQEFAGGTSLADDISMVVIKRG